MSIILSGAQLKRFESSPEIFPGNAYWDDYSFTVDGKEVVDPGEFDISSLPDNAEIVFSGGYLHRGNGVEDVEDVLERWLAEQTVTLLVLEVDADRADIVKAAVRDIEGVRNVR